MVVLFVCESNDVAYLYVGIYKTLVIYHFLKIIYFILIHT